MPAQIAAFANGLIDLVQLQAMGKTIQELADTLVPVLDLGDLYLASRETTVFSVSAAVIVNESIAVEVAVPAGELWWVTNVGAFTGTAVAEALSTQLVRRVENSVAPMGPVLVLGASATGWVLTDMRAFWARAGTKFRLWSTLVTGAPTAVITVQCVRLRA